jgi:Flp pilus assembly protein TadD
VLAKEGVAIVPALFLVVAVAVPGAAGLADRPGLATAGARRALGTAALVAGALALALLPYLAVRGFALAAPVAARWFSGVPVSTVAFTMSRVLAEYLRILAFPAFLGTDFAYVARIPQIAAPDLALAIFTLCWLAVLAAGVLLLRGAPLASAGIVWVFAALLPVLQLVPIGVLMAERLLYLPSVGACLAAAAALARAIPNPAAPGDPAVPAASPRRGAAAALVVLALVPALAVRGAVRAHDWRSDLALFEAELPKAPEDPVVNNNLAVAYTARGEPARAIPRLQVVLDRSPWYWRAHVNLGIAYQSLGDRDRARAALEVAERLAPAETSPRFFLARLEAEQGHLDRAIELLGLARRLKPDEARLARQQGEYLIRAGRGDEARAALQEALRVDPADGEARRLLGLVAGR